MWMKGEPWNMKVKHSKILRIFQLTSGRVVISINNNIIIIIIVIIISSSSSSISIFIIVVAIIILVVELAAQECVQHKPQLPEQHTHPCWSLRCCCCCYCCNFYYCYFYHFYYCFCCYCYYFYFCYCYYRYCRYCYYCYYFSIKKIITIIKSTLLLNARKLLKTHFYQDLSLT